MRKTSLLAMACTAAVMLTACGKDEGKTSPASSSQVSGSSPAESVTKEESSGTKVSYKEMLPDIQSAFPDETVEIIRSGMYDNFFLAEVKGYKESEYDAYLEACNSIFMRTRTIPLRHEPPTENSMYPCSFLKTNARC